MKVRLHNSLLRIEAKQMMFNETGRLENFTRQLRNKWAFLHQLSGTFLYSNSHF